MATPFSPTPKDVTRYQQLRRLARDLNHRITKTIPRHAYIDVGRAAGILHNGAIVLESEDMSSVLMDSCLYDWFENGKNVVGRYAETHPAAQGTDERYLLDAYLQAKYRILLTQSIVPGAGIGCLDVLNKEKLFVMDLGLSQSAKGSAAVFATRTIPLGEYSMTSGAGLPVNSKELLQEALRLSESGKHDSPASAGRLALSIVRACLAAGSAKHIAYQDIGTKSAQPPRQSRRSWF